MGMLMHHTWLAEQEKQKKQTKVAEPAPVEAEPEKEPVKAPVKKTGKENGWQTEGNQVKGWQT